MRIAVIGTQNSGKSYFIDSFLRQWRTYRKPEKTYREFLDPDTPLNQNGTMESQKAIRDALAEQAIRYAEEKHIIHDRCILDNLVYTMWLADKGKIKDDAFITETIHMTRETLKLFDVIFFLPLHERSKVELTEKEFRDLDQTYRLEIDNLFLAVLDSYRQRSGIVFPLENSPALIEIYGDEANGEKTAMVADYIGPDGDPVEQEGSILQTLENEFYESAIRKQQEMMWEEEQRQKTEEERIRRSIRDINQSIQ